MISFGHNKKIFQGRRRELRQYQTDAEAKLWYFLRGRRFCSLKFCRQYGIGPYILDFYCHALRLAIEADGSQHAELGQYAYDLERTRFLNLHHVRVLRFWNDDVLKDIDAVLEEIRSVVEDSPPSPLSFREGEPESLP
jgi:very-short-patch-repair endonuclease